MLVPADVWDKPEIARSSWFPLRGLTQEANTKSSKKSSNFKILLYVLFGFNPKASGHYAVPFLKILGCNIPHGSQC